MNRIVLIFVIFFTLQSFSQKDSIVTYFNAKNLATTNKTDFKFIQVTTKKNDSLWLFRRFLKNGKLFNYWHSKTSDSKQKVGEFVSFDLNDSIKSIFFYNDKGLKHGKYSSWFINRKKNTEGNYINGKKEGLWKYYYYNGKIAARGFFKKDSLLKEQFFDVDGNNKPKPKDLSKKAKFKGGINKFRNKIRDINNKIDVKLRGKIHISFIVDVNGEINFVKIFGATPKFLSDIIITNIKKIKGWEPAEHLGRKIPVNFSFPITFK